MRNRSAAVSFIFALEAIPSLIVAGSFGLLPMITWPTASGTDPARMHTAAATTQFALRIASPSPWYPVFIIGWPSAIL